MKKRPKDTPFNPLTGTKTFWMFSETARERLISDELRKMSMEIISSLPPPKTAGDFWVFANGQMIDSVFYSYDDYPRITIRLGDPTSGKNTFDHASAVFWELNKGYKINVISDSEKPDSVTNMYVSYNFTSYDGTKTATEYDYLTLENAYNACYAMFYDFQLWKKEKYGKAV